MKVELKTDGGSTIELEDLNKETVNVTVKTAENTHGTLSFYLIKEDLLSAVKAICRK